MSTLNLNLGFLCQACGGYCQTLAEWHHHLHQPTHLEGARKAVLNWGEREKACALVIYGSAPLGRDGRVVDYLSGLFGGRTILRDFVWWEGRPWIGVAQFGSSAEVEQIVGSVKNRMFFIEPDQYCHVREGSCLRRVEWEDLLQEYEGSAMNLDSTPQFSNATPSSSPDNAWVRSMCLRHCLASILNWIQIPMKEGNGTDDILHRFQILLNENARGGGEGEKNQLNVCLGRQWHLRFRYPPKESIGSTPLSFILRRDVDGDAVVAFSPKEFQEIQAKLFGMEQGQMLFLSCCPVLSQIQEKSPEMIYFSIKHPVTEKLTDVVVSAEPHLVLEDQLWRLIRMLSTFDPYVFPVLAAANYWSATNSIYVGEMEGNYLNMWDPAGLDLLVVLYFQRNGKIPTCKTILEHLHHARMFEETDIGFYENPKHAKEWKEYKNTSNIDPRSEPFLEEMFKHLYEFFLFCGGLLERENEWGSDWLLNTRDAEIVSVIDLLTGSLGESDSSLSTAERVALRRSLGRERNPDKFVMLNPFSTNWRISLINAEQAFGAMKVTGNRLRAYMVHGSAANLDMEEFLKLLKIDEKELGSSNAISIEEHPQSLPNPVRFPKPAHADERKSPPPKRMRLMERSDLGESSLSTLYPTPPSTSTISAASLKEGVGGIGDNLRFIRKNITISDEDHSTARDLTSRLQGFLKDCTNISGLSNLASAEVFMSRHWALKLRFSPTQGKHFNVPLTLLICQPREHEEQREGLIDDDLNRVNRLLLKVDREGNKSFLSYELRSTSHVPLPFQRNDHKAVYTCLRYRLHRPSTPDYFDVSIRSDPRLIVEVQVWRLHKFLCTFDSRCSPVLELTYYWARINSMPVGSHRGHFNDLPAPSGISWLLILFFQKEGLVPSTRRLMEYPHEKKLFEGMNIGFSDSPVHTSMWETEKNSEKWGRDHHPDSEQFAEEVLQLFYQFLIFCKKLGKGSGEGYGWVVNTRDGEIIPRKDIFPSPSSWSRVPNTSKLTSGEFAAVRKSLDKQDRDMLVILNPIAINWKISTDNWQPAVEAMGRTERKLEDYFHERKREKRGNGGKGHTPDLGDFLKLFEV